MEEKNVNKEPPVSHPEIVPGIGALSGRAWLNLWRRTLALSNSDRTNVLHLIPPHARKSPPNYLDCQTYVALKIADLMKRAKEH